MTKAQHKATLSIYGRNVDIHAPPFVPVSQLDKWLEETLKSEGVKLVSKTWDNTEPTPPEAA